uniref:Uncharacterized protein n=1 Tax=Steinernema glaseri TaxID=37863 RepID=A0A1I7Y048_9BILA
MTSEVGFVRNNPFIQNDMGIRKTCRIVPSASKLGISTGGGINWQCRKSNGVPQSASFPTISLGVKSQLERPIIVLQQHVNNKNLEEKGDSASICPWGVSL